MPLRPFLPAGRALAVAAALAVAPLASADPARGAAPQEPAPDAPPAAWRVATKESPPFAHRDRDGRWTGLSIELAEALARELGRDLELVEAPTVAALLDAVTTGEADAALAAITVTPEREARVDFSHPFYTSGLGVAVRGDGADAGLGSLARALASPAFLRIVGLLVVGLVAGGALFWLVERRRNPQFEGGRRGVGFGTWWATIILFGHKGVFPRTFVGHLLAGAGMLTSILALSVLTGAIASVLTVDRMEASVRGLDDLRRLRVAAVADTSGAAFLAANGVAFRPLADASACLAAVAERRADAAVHDAPLLLHLVAEEHPELRVLERTFAAQDYAIAFPLGSAERKRVNRELLELRASEAWERMVLRHVGR